MGLMMLLYANYNQQLLSRCVTCQDICVQQLHAAKCQLPKLEVNLSRFAAMLLLHNKDQQ